MGTTVKCLAYAEKPFKCRIILIIKKRDTLNYLFRTKELSNFAILIIHFTFKFICKVYEIKRHWQTKKTTHHIIIP